MQDNSMAVKQEIKVLDNWHEVLLSTLDLAESNNESN